MTGFEPLTSSVVSDRSANHCPGKYLLKLIYPAVKGFESLVLEATALPPI